MNIGKYIIQEVDKILNFIEEKICLSLDEKKEYLSNPPKEL